MCEECIVKLNEYECNCKCQMSWVNEYSVCSICNHTIDGDDEI